MTDTKQIISRITREILDSSTGEMLAEERIEKRRVSREPDFIKLYLDDIMLLSDIPKQKSDIMYLLLKKMNYDNEITIVHAHKAEISEKLNCSLINIDKTLKILCDKGILRRKYRGVYEANPYLFGKGRWEDIEALRLQIDYQKGGKKRIIGIYEEGKIELKDVELMKGAKNDNK